MDEHRIEIRIEEKSDAWEGIKEEARRLNISTNKVCQILCINHFENQYRIAHGLEIRPPSSLTQLPDNKTSLEVYQEESINQDGLSALQRALDLSQ